ncbi:hypothetical protein LEP1GSC170_2690 [Leptospira interrogans serovar Bataviae str. HAI135]|nr:hypothetical protein LEP1GSC170_2690 [Leptospira interrogans serovar Bataviae str. HAI135]
MEPIPKDKKVQSNSDSITEWNDWELVPISAISHHLYCTRQNSLIHVEGIFEENHLTASGNIGHTFVDQERSISDHGLKKKPLLEFILISSVYKELLILSNSQKKNLPSP